MLTSMLTESTVTFIALGAIFAFSFYAVLNAGQLSLGQAGFASVAAYTSVLLAPDPDVVGAIPAMLIALVIGAAGGPAAAGPTAPTVTRGTSSAGTTPTTSGSGRRSTGVYAAPEWNRDCPRRGCPG